MWWLAAGADLLLGSQCGGCGRPGRTLCADCAAVVAATQPFRPMPQAAPPGLPVTMSGARYLGIWPSLVSAYKEHQVWSLARPLAEVTWRAVVALVVERRASGAIRLLPMPSRAAAVRRRGLDTTAELARRVSGLARRAGWRLPVGSDLRLRRRVVDQAGLDVLGRRANLAGALRARPPRAPAPAVIILDDLITTGASLTEAARALRTAGHPVLGAVTTLAAPRQGGPDDIGPDILGD